MSTDLDTNSFRVPTRRITVELFTLDGNDGTRGTMHHGESLYESGTGADIVNELNDDRAFIPFVADDGDAEQALINKQRILRVHVPDLTYDDLPQHGQAAPAESCTVWLSDESCRTGRPVVETPPANSRLIDKFNHAPTFVTFLTEHGVDFIHTAHIVRIDRIDGDA